MYPETRPILAFDVIDTHNLLTLALADISFYPPGFTVNTPTYQIYPPNFPSISLDYDQSSINIFNSNNLNITCTDDPNLITNLPDGVWKVSQSIAPATTYTNTKSFLRVDSLRHQFGQAFLKTDMVNCQGEVGSQAMGYLNQINAYIEGAVAASNQCNMVLAMNLYRFAQKTLSSFLKGECQSIPTRTSWY